MHSYANLSITQSPSSSIHHPSCVIDCIKELCSCSIVLWQCTHHQPLSPCFQHQNRIPTMSGEDPKPTSAAAPIESKPAVPLKDVNEAYAIKVKSDYVLSERPSCLAPPTIIAAASDGNNDRNNSSNNGSNKNNKSKRSKNNRGQNKKRPRDTKISDGDKACLAVVRGEPCPFQKSDRGCRYNHDLKEMLANRPNDLCDGEGGAVWLKGGCPFWNAKG